MTYDIKIINGTVIDGTGAPGRKADVAIKDGLIVAVGACDGDAARVIDAAGMIVTPGFVDIHTHYDGQISWDADLAPSCLHGVTTAVMGSCGVGFAPCRESDRDRLISLMEGVEDIPGTALAEGITWNWESVPDYMNAIDFPHAIDFAVQVTHDPIRVYVMGERAVAGELATEEDVEKMRALVREALEAGAVGFSTGRTDNHRAADGGHTPAAEASERELTGIASAFKGLGHGVLQAVSDFDMVESPKRFDLEYDVLESMLAAADGHPMSISLMQRMRATTQWQQIIRRAEETNARGMTLRLQVGARGIGVLLGLQATFHPFMGFPSYKQIAHLSLAERVERMADPEFKARILTEKSDKVAGDGSAIPPLADELLAHLDFIAMRLYRFDEAFDYEPDPQTSILAQAMAKGESPLSVMYDAMLEDGGKELLYFPIYNYIDQNLDVVRTMLTHPLALPGLSDGGAHVGTVCDASFPTFMVSHWTRARTRGDKLPLERVIQMLTHDTAGFIGFADRGELAVGKKADVNVMDYERLTLLRPRMVKDLPAGGQRLLQDAIGYKATIVSGTIIAEDGKLTGALPGRLVRLGAGGART